MGFILNKNSSKIQILNNTIQLKQIINGKQGYPQPPSLFLDRKFCNWILRLCLKVESWSHQKFISFFSFG